MRAPCCRRRDGRSSTSSSSPLFFLLLTRSDLVTSWCYPTARLSFALPSWCRLACARPIARPRRLGPPSSPPPRPRASTSAPTPPEPRASGWQAVLDHSPVRALPLHRPPSPQRADSRPLPRFAQAARHVVVSLSPSSTAWRLQVTLLVRPSPSPDCEAMRRAARADLRPRSRAQLKIGCVVLLGLDSRLGPAWMGTSQWLRSGGAHRAPTGYGPSGGCMRDGCAGSPSVVPPAPAGLKGAS